jgi:hypothetical protein
LPTSIGGYWTKINLRSGLYAASYTGLGGRDTGLSQIYSPVQSGHLYGGPKVAASANLYGRLHCETLSPGQVGLLVELGRYSNDDAFSLGTVLPGLFDRLWPKAAHHLRLALMDAASMSADALRDDERHRLIDAIEALLPANGGFDSVGMIDALKNLGALDEDQTQHVTSAKAQIEAVLADRENPLAWDAAAGLWNAQFDHPYDSAYYEAWSDLANGDRKTLLLMAAQGIERNSLFASVLIAEIGSLADPVAGPILARWTALPPKKGVMVGDAIGGFALAYAALARLRCPLSDRSAEAASPADQALLACGEIVYWLNRNDLLEAERKRNCTGPLAVLTRHEAGVAAAVVGEFFRSDFVRFENAARPPGSEPLVMSFGRDFPNEVAAIYRAALKQPRRQTGYFEFFRVEDVIETALANLGRFGNANDIPLLRAWSVHPDHGYSAVRAIKMIEGRQQAKHALP